MLFDYLLHIHAMKSKLIINTSIEWFYPGVINYPYINVGAVLANTSPKAFKS